MPLYDVDQGSKQFYDYNAYCMSSISSSFVVNEVM